MLQKSFALILSVILTVCSTVIPKMDSYIDKKVKSMSLEQKIGQMLMPDFRQWEGKNVTALNDSISKAIRKYGFGGVILFAENCQGTEQTARLVSQLQKESVSGLAGMPMLVSIDQEGGSIIRLQTGSGTPGNMALGAINNETETKADSARIAEELSALGINTDFAPDMDVNTNPANPIIGIRSFSSNPNLVARMGTAYIKGLHEYNVASACKHFPGHGDTDVDSHTGLPMINKSYDSLKKTELVPFNATVKEGTDLIMTAHIVFPQIEKQTYTSISTGKKIQLPATLSKTIVTDILRKDMGYNGVVTTDAMNMDAIASHFKPADAAILAINAGVDILLMPVSATNAQSLNEFDKYISNIVSAVKSGKISETRINESVARILKLKAKRGVTSAYDEDVTSKVQKAKQVVGSKAHHEAEMQTAAKAVTVLKNSNNLLPLNPNSKTVFFYPFAGEEVSLKYGMRRVSTSLNAPVYNYRNASADDYNISGYNTVVIYTEMYSQYYLNPNNSKGWQAVFVPQMIKKAHNAGKKVVLVSINLPYDVAKYTDADAIMLAYGAKDMKSIPTVWNGEVPHMGVNIPASVEVIFGKAKPKGRLPVDVYKLNSDSTYSNTVLYPFGSGMNI